VLLVVLLVHLGFMATRFHAEAMHVPANEVGADEMARTAEASHDAGAVHAAGVSVEDCAIAWALPPANPVIHAVAGPTLPTRAFYLAGYVGSSCSLPRAIGPPLLADSQALLQVFRL